MSTSSPVRLVLFDVDGTLVDHDVAIAAGAQQWLMAMAMGWVDAGTIAALISEWDEIAERHFPAYRARLTTFQGQSRLRLREFLPRVGIDASTWSDGRLDDSSTPTSLPTRPRGGPCLTPIVVRASMPGTDASGHRSVSGCLHEMSGYLGKNIWRFAATQPRDSGSSL